MKALDPVECVFEDQEKCHEFVDTDLSIARVTIAH